MFAYRACADPESDAVIKKMNRRLEARLSAHWKKFSSEMEKCEQNVAYKVLLDDVITRITWWQCQIIVNAYIFAMNPQTENHTRE